MKKMLAVVVTVAMVSSPAWAVTWQQIDFCGIQGGAVSYDDSGDNVVVSGSAFFDQITSDGYLGVQQVGGDGIDLTVSGNFAMYGVFQYTDTANVLGWVSSNPTTPLALEIRARGVQLDFTPADCVPDFTENFTLDAVDIPGVDYLTATFAELGTHGYTEIGPGIWLDIAILTNDLAAMSVVIDGFPGKWGADIDAELLCGTLGGAIPGTTPGSGIRIAAVPEPATMSLLALGGLALIRRKR